MSAALTQQDVARRARLALVLRARPPRDGDGDGLYSPRKGMPDRTPVPGGTAAKAAGTAKKAPAKAGSRDRAEQVRRYVRAYTAGASIKQIADAAGVSYATVHKDLVNAGLQLRDRGGDRRRRPGVQSTRDRATAGELARIREASGASAEAKPAKKAAPMLAKRPARNATPTTGAEVRDRVMGTYGRHVPATKKTTDDLGRTWREHDEYQRAFARMAEELADLDPSDQDGVRAAAAKWRKAADRERGVSSMRASQRRGTFHHARGTAGMAAADQYENVADYLDGLADEPGPATAATPANAAPRRLTPGQAQAELGADPEKWAQAGRDGRVSRPEAARRIRAMAQSVANSNAIRNGGWSDRSTPEFDEEQRLAYEGGLAEVARIRALADEIEAWPAKAAPARATGAERKLTAAQQRMLDRVSAAGADGLRFGPADRGTMRALESRGLIDSEVARDDFVWQGIARPRAGAAAPTATPERHSEFGEPLRRRTPRDGDVAVWTPTNGLGTPTGEESVVGRVSRVGRHLVIDWEGGRREQVRPGAALDRDVTLYAGEGGPTKAAAPRAAFEASDTVRRLGAAQSRDEGREILSGLSRDQLREVAAAGGGQWRPRAGARKNEMVEDIIGLHVGARLDSAAIRDGMREGGTVVPLPARTGSTSTPDTPGSVADMAAYREAQGLPTRDRVTFAAAAGNLTGDDRAAFLAWLRDNPSGSLAAWQAQRGDRRQGSDFDPEEVAMSIQGHVDEFGVATASGPTAPQRQAQGEAGIRAALGGLNVAQLRRVASQYRMGRPPSGLTPAQTLDWMLAQWASDRGRWSLQ